MKATGEVYVYAVKYSNYNPAEVDSLWATKQLAEIECERLNEEARRGPVSLSDNWEVSKMRVFQTPFNQKGEA